MEEQERAKKDLDKLIVIIKEFKGQKFGDKYAEVLDWAERYLTDATYYFNKKDYFTSFGAANYAYGIIDGILIFEKKK